MWKVFSSKSAIDRTLIAAIGLSGTLLAGAHIFEAIGYPPCELCRDQREAHWVAIGVALLGLGISVFTSLRSAAIAAVGAVAVVYLISTVLAGYHTGVEYYFWPGPTSCASGAPAPLDGLDLGSALSAGPSGPSCAHALWRFLGVSMAGYNMLFSAAIFALCAITMVTASGAFKNRHNGSEMKIHKDGSKCP